MRIALIGNDYVQQFPVIGYGGIEICVENIAIELYNQNIDFFVVCPKRNITRPYPFEIHETQEAPTSITNKNSFYYSYSVAKTLENLQFDAIWSQSHWSVEPLLKFKKPIICTFHDSCEKQNGWIKKNDNVRYRFLSKFQYNNWVTEEWEKEISFLCYLGLNNKDFIQFEKENYFLWCAGLRWGLQAKGLDIFIKLAEINSNYNFIAHGEGNKDLEKYLYNIKLPNFYFKGKLDHGADHQKAFGRAKAFIMPTQIMDTFPRTCLEASSKGTPVIGSNNGSIPEIINICGGKTCKSLEDYSRALNINFDYNKIFNNSKIFLIENEIKTLISESKNI